MYIRKTKIKSNKAGSEDYFTFRLVFSERIADKVKQRTLLNLGSNFSLPKDQWHSLTDRIDQILSGQQSLLSEPELIESLAQQYAAQIVAKNPVFSDNLDTRLEDFQEVDVDSIEMVRPRSVGVENVALNILEELQLPQTLKMAGFNGPQCSDALGIIIGRMAVPDSESGTRRWLREHSALGELLDVNFEGELSNNRLYRISDYLVKNREIIENALFSRIETLFNIESTVTLYDLTNTYFEGVMAANQKAKNGRSKEKRSDCPLITLGLVLDGSGFVLRSKAFAGNVAESNTLKEMLDGLKAPTGALVIMDAGIATEANISWLIEHNYRYLVVSRERNRQFDEELAISTTTASSKTIQIQRVVSDDKKEVRLYCYSKEREAKEAAINKQFSDRFESELQKISDGLSKPRSEKRKDKLLERIGRLKQKSKGIGRHYKIEMTTDENGKNVTSLKWEREPIDGSRMTHPGVYCLRTNELEMDEATLWRTYSTLTDLEAVFRSMKSELGLRPVYHHNVERVEGHLFITVLAYQAVQAIRNKLKAHEIHDSWSSLRKTLSSQQRITVTFKQRDGRTLHVRKATKPEPKLQKIYDILNVSPSPGGIQKLII